MNLIDMMHYSSYFAPMKFTHRLIPSLSVLLPLATLAAPEIKGPYLPASELPKNVCALYAINFSTSETPIDKDLKPTGPAKTETIPESFYCSATLIRDDAVLTAAHCFQGVMEYKPRLMQDRQGQRYRVDLKMDHVEIRCPGDDGKMEVHSTTVADGWPHPRFGPKPEAGVYDVALLKTKEKWKTKPMPVAFAPDSVREIIDMNRTCRTFGYGVDNEKNVGILHGLKITSDLFYSPGTIAFAGVTGVDHGDSGGAMFCKDHQGVDTLVAVTSRLHDTNPNDKSYGSYFVATDFNSEWVDFALRHEILNHESVVEYNFSELEERNALLGKCIADRQNEGLRKRDLTDLITAYREINQNVKGLKQDLANGSKPAGVVRIYLDDSYKAAKGAIQSCESLKNFGRRLR